jgi:hypothetical protein
MIKTIILVLALTVVGVFVGYAAAWGAWEMNHPGHAPENVAGNYWGAFLGAPIGGTIGVISGTILAIRRFRATSSSCRGGGYGL